MHSSKVYVREVFKFLLLIIDKEGAFKLDWEDGLIAKTCLTHEREKKSAP